MDLSVTTTPTNPDGPSAGSGLQTDTISPSDRGTANQPSPSPSEDIAPTFTANESPKPTIGRLPEPNRPTSGPSKHTHKPYVRTDAPSDRLFSQSPSQSPSGGSEPMSPLEPLHEPTISPRPEPSIWTQAPSIDSPVAPTAPTADEPSHLAPQSEAPSLPRSIFPSTFVPSSSFPTFPPTLESPGFLSVEPTFTARIPTLFPSKDPTVPEVTPNSVAPTSEFTDIGLPTSTGKCTLEDVRQCNSAASSQCISIKPQSDFSRGECRFEVENPNGLSSLREKGRRGYSENEIVSRLAYHKERLALLRLNNS
ncbi:hypothetical protein MHU86_16128 [Fragilaria crotonensis]|nr:hypothetical protein MHU86_16128 [Fragilaria crotonensis]